jgi:hypothetical protein
MQLPVGTKPPPDFLDNALVIAMMMKHGITDNKSLTTLWVLKTHKLWDFYGGGGNVLEHQVVNLLFRVEQNFNTVFGNGWEIQQAKNKYPKIAAVIRKVRVNGPHFRSILTAWLIITEKPHEIRIDEGNMVLVPTPIQCRPVPAPCPAPASSPAPQHQQLCYNL